MPWIYNASTQAEQESQWRTIVTISLVFTTLMVLVGGLRLWVRRQNIAADDWITLVTMLLSFLFNVFTVLQTRFGLGLPIELRPKAESHSFTVYNYAARPFYLWGIAGFKLALCVSYMRLTERSMNRAYRRFIVTVAVLSTLAQTTFVLLNLFSCRPLAKIFNNDLEGTCLPYGPLNYIISAVTIFSDVIIFLLPIPLIIKLQLNRGVKLGLGLTFSLGLLTTVCSILRMTQIHRIAYGDGDSSLLVMYSALEVNVGIIVSCLPLLRPLLRHLPSKIRELVLSSHRTRIAGQTGYDDSYQLHSYGKGSTVVRSKLASHVAKDETHVATDEQWEESSSERGILEETESDKHGGIRMTVDIDIDRVSNSQPDGHYHAWDGRT